MATFKNTSDQTLEFPSLVLTVNPGDTFEGPDDLVAEGVVAVNAASKPAAPARPAAPATTPTPSASSDSEAGA